MNNLTEAILLFNTHSGAASATASVLAFALKSIASAGFVVVQTFSVLSSYVAAVLTPLGLIMTGEFKLALDVFKQAPVQISAGLQDMGRAINKLWDAAAPKTEAGAASVEKAVLNLGATAKETKDEFADLMAEMSGVDKNFHKDLQTLYAGFKQGRITVEDYNAAVQELLETKTEAGKAFRKFREEGVKRLADEEKKRADQLRESIDADQKQLDAMIRSNDEFGKSATQIAEMNLAKLELTRSTLDFAAATWEEVDALDKRIELAKKMVGAAGQSDILRANDELEKKRREEALRTAQTIENSLTDALLRGFESGKDFSANFRDTLVNMFKSLVLRPVIQFLVSPISGAITAALGSMIPGMANASGGGAGGGGLSTLSSLTSLLSGQGVGRTISDLTMLATGRNLLPNAPNVANWQYGLAGFGGGFVGGKIGGQTGATLGSIGATIGMATGNPILAVVGSVVGGALGKVFGGSDKPKKVGHRLVGELSMDDFVGQGYKLYKGGKQKAYGAGTDYMAWNWGGKEAVEAFSAGMRSILDYGKQLGLNTSELAKQLAAVRVPIDISKAKNEMMTPKFVAAANAAVEALKQQFIPALQQAAEMVKQLGARETEIMTQAFPSLVRDVRGKLGIDTLLEAQRGLAIAEFQAPLDRVSAARSQLNEMFTRGMGGDLGAVNAFPALLQSALTIGRDVFASGSGFQEMFREGNVMLNELLTRQRALETDILADVPLTIRETSQDQIAALRAQTNAIVSELREVRAELTRLREAA